MTRGVFLAMAAATAVGWAAAPGPAGPSVAIDVGHNVEKPGAISARGRTELEFNREMARRVRKALEEKGVDAFLINESGRMKGLAERSQEAAARGAGLFVSIHHDAVNEKYYRDWIYEGKSRRYSDEFCGFSVFFSGKNAEPGASRNLAERIGQALRAAEFTPTLHHAEPIPGENRPLLDPGRGVYQFDDLIVLKTSPMPAVLVECGVIVHRDEELMLRDPENQQRIAEAIASGIVAYLAKPGVRLSEKPAAEEAGKGSR